MSSFVRGFKFLLGILKKKTLNYVWEILNAHQLCFTAHHIYVSIEMECGGVIGCVRVELLLCGGDDGAREGVGAWMSFNAMLRKAGINNLKYRNGRLRGL